MEQQQMAEEEQYWLLAAALNECVEKGVSQANLLFLCWATGFNVKHLERETNEQHRISVC